MLQVLRRGGVLTIKIRRDYFGVVFLLLESIFIKKKYRPIVSTKTQTVFVLKFQVFCNFLSIFPLPIRSIEFQIFCFIIIYYFYYSIIIICNLLFY